MKDAQAPHAHGPSYARELRAQSLQERAQADRRRRGSGRRVESKSWWGTASLRRAKRLFGYRRLRKHTGKKNTNSGY
eukprot:2996123-Rhodomonas_salina.6